jgi:hypothetical protein
LDKVILDDKKVAKTNEHIKQSKVLACFSRLQVIVKNIFRNHQKGLMLATINERI